jgi:hypothetical protein
MRILRRGDTVRTPGQEAARSAVARIDAAQAEADRRQPEVARIAAALRGLQQRNHFAELIDQALRGGHR